MKHPTCLGKVVPKDVFIDAKRKLQTPPFPHHIAWYNLIPSCNSRNHCNLWREDKFIYPFILDQGAISQIRYSKEGICNSIEYMDDINNLNLNHQDLINIRKILFFLGSKINEITIDEKELVLSYITLLDINNTGLSGTYSDDRNYQLLLQYDYFFKVKPIL
jgi:hypothetical protein